MTPPTTAPQRCEIALPSRTPPHIRSQPGPENQRRAANSSRTARAIRTPTTTRHAVESEMTPVGSDDGRHEREQADAEALALHLDPVPIEGQTHQE
jgi:hypothetical protein